MKARMILALVLVFAGMSITPFPKEEKLKVRDHVKDQGILIQKSELAKWCNDHFEVDDIYFESIIITKANKNLYYLIASESNHNRAFAFELEKQNKALWLSPQKIMNICDSGDGLASFVVADKKIIGCKSGDHTIYIIE